ncbi:MAG: DUF2199 domain-containing protein [Stellaceae bacterium]
MSETFVCGICGEAHSKLPTDHAWQLPDEVSAIREPERSERAKFDSDLCKYDGRYFIRCVLPVPFVDRTGYFGWGIWVEVDRRVFERYLSLYEADGSGEPRYAGKLANVLPRYDEPLGADVLVQFGASTKRPSVHFPSEANSELALEQKHGIDTVRHHAILAALHAGD